jgi:methyltransferase
MAFLLFICFVIFQRLLELVVAKRNENWARSQGAVEYGQSHYPYMIALHTSFIISIIIEYALTRKVFDLWIFVFFLVLISFKAWTISSLGKYWNTKILRVPNSAFIKKGPYKYLNHPNYVIVVLEILAIPMVFHLYITAITFTILNAWMLSVRIKEEERIWK